MNACRYPSCRREQTTAGCLRNHCTHPARVEACTRKVIYKREEDGIVLIDQDRCRGCRHCNQACPYNKIYFNEVLGKSQKCIFCYPRLEKGKVNAYAAQCPGRLRFVGLLDDPESPVHKLVLKYKVALGLLPDRGTEPNFALYRLIVKYKIDSHSAPSDPVTLDGAC